MRPPQKGQADLSHPHQQTTVPGLGSRAPVQVTGGALVLLIKAQPSVPPQWSGVFLFPFSPLDKNVPGVHFHRQAKDE